MAQPRPSRALLIVNTDFGGDPEFGTRRGAKREAEKLSKVLSRLNYEVKLMHNQTAKEMEDLYRQGTRPAASPSAPSSSSPSPARPHSPPPDPSTLCHSPRQRLTASLGPCLCRERL